MEVPILEVFERQPTMSTGCLAARTGTSDASVQRTLHEQQLHPYHIQPVQELVPHDAPARRQICQWSLEQSTEEPTFTAKALFMDESWFSRAGITMNMCGQTKILMPFDLTTQNDSFPLTCGLEFQATASYAVTFYQNGSVLAITSLSFENI
jgi:hypothetical protein